MTSTETETFHKITGDVAKQTNFWQGATAQYEIALAELTRAMGGPDIGDAEVDKLADRIDAAMLSEPSSIAGVVTLLNLVLEAEGDALEKPVRVAIANSIICLRTLTGSLQ